MAFESDPRFDQWRKMYKSHPQGFLLTSHVERATHDIFFNSLKSQSLELFSLFNTKEQLDKFLSKMLRYWEMQENFERCSEIVELGKSITKLWEQKEDVSELNPEERLKRWLNSAI